MSVSKEEILTALEDLRARSRERGFKQSIDVMINLKELDLKRPENRVNLNVHLPHGAGGEQKVCVFATGDMALRARRAGVDLVVDQDQLRDLSSNRKEAKKLLGKYDIFLAEASLMPAVGRIAGPILGPKGKMPTPVPPNASIEQIVERQKNVVIVRSRDKPLIQLSVGTEDMDEKKLSENIETLLSALVGNLKRGIGNIRSIYVKTSMGEPVRLK